jgi:hypothetical protein
MPIAQLPDEESGVQFGAAVDFQSVALDHDSNPQATGGDPFSAGRAI